jgi:hypothetical protein
MLQAVKIGVFGITLDLIVDDASVSTAQPPPAPARAIWKPPASAE